MFGVLARGCGQRTPEGMQSTIPSSTCGCCTQVREACPSCPELFPTVDARPTQAFGRTQPQLTSDSKFMRDPEPETSNP